MLDCKRELVTLAILKSAWLCSSKILFMWVIVQVSLVDFKSRFQADIALLLLLLLFVSTSKDNFWSWSMYIWFLKFKGAQRKEHLKSDVYMVLRMLFHFWRVSFIRCLIKAFIFHNFDLFLVHEQRCTESTTLLFQRNVRARDMGLELSLVESPDTLLGSPCTALYTPGRRDSRPLSLLTREGNGVPERGVVCEAKAPLTQ